MHQGRAAKGEIVITQGEPTTDLSVVKSGVLKVVSSGEHGRQKAMVNRLCENEYFGEIGLLERIPRTATVLAEDDCLLYRIEGDAFLDAVDEAPVSLGLVLGGISERLARTHPSYRSKTPSGDPTL